MTKKYLPFFLLFIFLPALCTAQNTWQSTNNFHSIKVCLQSRDTIYTSSIGGGIAKSVDAGSTWSYPTNQVSFFVNGICMATNSTGYYYTYNNSCGDITCQISEVYKTTDAGCSWSKITSPSSQGNTEYITALSFADAATGWCSTSKGNIFKTVNGGNTWSLQLAAGIVLFNIKCYNNQLIVATGTNSKVFSSTNGGTSWVTNTLNPYNTYVQGIAFADANAIYVASGTIYKSVDGGLSWQPNFTLPLGTNGFQDVAFRDAAYGIAVASGVGVFKTTDGGNNWLQFTTDGTGIENITLKNGTEIASAAGTILKNAPSQNTYWKIIANGSMTIVTRIKYSHDGAMAFTDGKLSGRLQKSADFGKNWQPVNFESTAFGVFNAVSKDDAGSGIAVGRFGTVYNTLNNGQDWKYQLNHYPLPMQTNDLLDVQLNNSGKAWAVGQKGTIIYSTDRGVNWQPQNSTTVKDLFSVSFINDNTGFAGGDNSILKTSNGGSSWQTALGMTNRTFKEVKCVIPGVLYAVNNSTGGTDTTFLLKSIDGGSTWFRTLTLAYPYSYFQFVPLQGISAISDTELRAYTTDSIYYSSNGGQTWQSSYFGYPIEKIKFLNHSQGYLLSGQSVFYTVNAGQTWSVYTPIDGVSFKGLEVKSGKVTVCGTGSTILHNENNLAVRDDWQYQLQPREFSDGNGVFDFIDSLHGWKFHLINRGISYTANGGKSWKVNAIISVSTDTTLSDIHFTDINNGYATDNHGNYLKTSDNGKTWQYKNVSTSGENLGSISFFDAGHGFIAGSNGLFIYTSNGGTSFTTGHLPSGESIGKVICTGPASAWIRTASKLYYTDNGGTSWMPRTLPASTNITDIAFINDSTGWVLCYSSALPVTYGTTNFGATWTALPLVGNTIPFGLTVSGIAFNKLKQGIAITDGVAVGQGYLYILPSLVDSLNASFTIDTLDFCKRQIRLNAVSSMPLTNINWKIGGVSYSGSPLTITLPATPDTVSIEFYAAAQSAAACNLVVNLTDTVKTVLRFDTLPIAKFIYDSACNNTIFHFKNQSSTVTPEKYWWSFGDGKLSTLKNPSNTYTLRGTYPVNLVAYSKNGCPSDTALKIIITGTHVPMPITKSNDIDCSHTLVRLTVPAGFSYEWSPKTNISNPYIFNPIVNPAFTQLYIVSIKDTSGCSTTDSVMVYVNGKGAGDIYLANAFTPNGDGINDCISAKTSGTFEYFEFSIFNRYGERVFFTRSPFDCWDGRYKGKILSTFNYVYYIKAKNGCGSFEKKGNILLIR